MGTSGIASELSLEPRVYVGECLHSDPFQPPFGTRDCGGCSETRWRWPEGIFAFGVGRCVDRAVWLSRNYLVEHRLF